MKSHLMRSFALACAAVVIGGCTIEVENPNAGDTKKVIGTPNDAESLLSTYYKRWSSGVYGSTTNIEGIGNVQSLMNYSSLANNCQNNHWPFTGATNGNSLGNVCQGEQYRLYSVMNEVTRVASDLLRKMNDTGTAKLSLNISTSTPDQDARNLRAKAFAEFLRGLSLGYLAMIHDSSSIVSPKMGTSDADCVKEPLTGVCTGALRGYKEVAESAYVAFDRAILYAQPTAVITGGGGFPIPSTWLPAATWTATNHFTSSAVTMDAPTFVKLIRTYRARIRANVARTPTERQAADWNAIIADAQNGITSDHLVTTSTTSGPGNSWRAQYYSFTTWHQMPAFFIGMADNSGNYAAWIGQSVGERGAGNTGFFMTSPDARFPQGADRTAQNTDFAITQCDVAATPCKRYFVNRAPGSDQFSGAGWGWSNYDHVRFYSWFRKGDGGSGQNGNTPFFTIAELDLIQAEGLYYQGNYTAAAALINKTRTAAPDCNPSVKTGTPPTVCPGTAVQVAYGGNLPAITAFDATTVVPGGGTNCVPKVPQAPAYNSVGCGNMWDALKYEKRIETAYTSFLPWFLDGRGWGDLPAGTPLYWAVPYQELLARDRPIAALYGAGPGAGNAAGSFQAGKGVYGW